MPQFSDPFVVIINPPDIQSGMPGDGLALSVVLQNQGEHGAVIDVFLDDAEQIPRQWCRAARQRLALDPQQSGEVVFEFELPSNALPGSYDYTLVVDAPEHYPEETPLQYPQCLRVLLKAQTAVRINDPTFFLNPATNPQKPARLSPGDIKPIEVRVENRSNLVDRFRLTCLDLDEDWFTVRYPSSNINALGILAEADCLELNPGDRGLIRLEAHPPLNTLAGIYSPTFRLHSDNQPDLVLLDLLYLDVQAVETLSVDLETLLDRVSHRPGQYQLHLANRGNVIRQLSFSASSRDEDEVCTYDYQPDRVRLQPGREAQVQLQVMPIRKWRRPFLGSGQAIPFQVEIQDAQGYKLPERQPQGILIWKARPWWQFLLLVLLVLGILGGVGSLVWFLFFRPPLPIVIEEFRPTSSEYIEGDSVQLSWKIRNPDRIQRLDLTTQVQDANPIEPKTFEFNQGVPPSDLKDTCPERELLCGQYVIGKLAASKYGFNLQATPRSGQSPAPSSLNVTVAAKPEPEITRFVSAQSEFASGAPIPLSWTIGNIGQLASLSVIATDKDGSSASRKDYSFAQGIPKELQEFCSRKVETLTCTNVPVNGLKSGQYTFQLSGSSVKGNAIDAQPTASIAIKPRSLRIESFSVNGQSGGGNVRLNVNQPLSISWSVAGGEGTVDVEITPYGGGFPASGSQTLGTFATAGDRSIQITAIDEAGQKVSGPGFVVTVIAPSPRPLPSRSPTVRRSRGSTLAPP